MNLSIRYIILINLSLSLSLSHIQTKSMSKQLLNVSQTFSRTLQNTVQTPSRYLPDTYKTPSRHPYKFGAGSYCCSYCSCDRGETKSTPSTTKLSWSSSSEWSLTNAIWGSHGYKLIKVRIRQSVCNVLSGLLLCNFHFQFNTIERCETFREESK